MEGFNPSESERLSHAEDAEDGEGGLVDEDDAKLEEDELDGILSSALEAREGYRPPAVYARERDLSWPFCECSGGLPLIFRNGLMAPMSSIIEEACEDEMDRAEPTPPQSSVLPPWCFLGSANVAKIAFPAELRFVPERGEQKI